MLRNIPSRLGLGLKAGVRMMSSMSTNGSINPMLINLPKSMLRPMMNTQITKQSLVAQLPLINKVKPVVKDEETNLLEIKDETNQESMQLDSVMRKRRYKIKKHKFRKRRKAQRELRRKLKK